MTAPLLSIAILVNAIADLAGVLGTSTARVLEDTCNGQPYNSSQEYCLMLPGEHFSIFESCTSFRALFTDWRRHHMSPPASARWTCLLQTSPWHCVLLRHPVHALHQLPWLWAGLLMAATTQVTTIAPLTTPRMGWFMVKESAMQEHVPLILPQLVPHLVRPRLGSHCIKGSGWLPSLASINTRSVEYLTPCLQLL